VITESFPAAVRTTSAAIAFSTGGVVGGFSPAVALWVANKAHDLRWGVAVPTCILAVGILVNLLWVAEHSQRRIWDEVEGRPPGSSTG